jgi:hypothetical protein
VSSKQQVYRDIITITERLAEARKDLDKNPGHYRALYIQKLLKEREALQKQITPTLVTGKLNDDPHTDSAGHGRISYLRPQKAGPSPA